MKCHRQGCGRDAAWQIGWKVWALVTPPRARTDSNCAKALTSLCVCEDHRRTTQTTDLLTPDGRAMITRAFSGAGRSMPDLGSIELAFEPIIDGKPVDVTKPPIHGRA